MPRKTITNLKILICIRCGYEWVPRIAEEPKRCARCKSRYWNDEYEREGAAEKVRQSWDLRREKLRKPSKKDKKSKG